MSKMSQLHAELTSQAAELGFESIEQAEENGYTVVYGTDRATLESVDIESEQDKAHKAWLKERDEVLGDLTNLMVHNAYDYDIVLKAYNFIKEQCHD